MAATIFELQWISYVLHDLNVSPPLPVKLYCDNQVALHISHNAVFHEKTKYLEIVCHVVRDKLKEGFIQPMYISTKE